jgi:hypothetical protein
MPIILRYVVPNIISQDITKQDELSPDIIEEKLYITSRISELFNRTWKVDNRQLLTDLEGIESDLVQSYSEEEKEAYKTYNTSINTIATILEKYWYKGNREWFGDYFNSLEGEDDEDSDVMNLEDLYADYHEVLLPLESANESILDWYWKIDLLIALRKVTKKLRETMQIIENYRNWNKKQQIEYIFEEYPRTKEAILSWKAKEICTPFGITFLVDRSFSDVSDSTYWYQLVNTPFSMVFIWNWSTKDERVNTIRHESRHNIFGLLELNWRFWLTKKRLKQWVASELSKRDFYKKIIRESEQWKAYSALFIAEKRKTNDNPFSDIIMAYITWLKDEILANFDNLLKWIWSTDMNHSRKLVQFIKEVEQMIPWNDEESLFLKRTFAKNSLKMLKDFYKELSFYLFIARNGNEAIKEVIRHLLYLSDMNDLSVVQVYLSNKLGEELFDSLHELYPFLTNIKLDEVLVGGKTKTNMDVLNDRLLAALIKNHQSFLPYLNNDWQLKSEFQTDEMLWKIYQVLAFFFQKPKWIDSYAMSIIPYILKSAIPEDPWKKKFRNLEKQLRQKRKK